MSQLGEPAFYKLLAHPERYALLKRLMASEATLSQLGEEFKQSPAHIRHHLMTLERAGLVEFVGARPVQGGPEKYYRAARRALFIHQAVLPEMPGDKVSLVIGSMDAGVAHLAEYFSRNGAPFVFLPVPLSSLDGLIALRQGLCQMSTCHLIDPQSEEYNRSYIRHLFPSQPVALVQIFRREEGLMVKPGNPLGIRSLEDLARPDIDFVNREPGSGVRQWLDLHLQRLGIPVRQVRGYENLANSHTGVARRIYEGSADCGIGIVASAREFGLEFIPLFEEPYEIAAPLSLVADPHYAPFFDYLNSGEFRLVVRGLDGYLVPQDFGKLEVIG
jgi:putative molybdopterin biosynthesis protein